jgi:hypothetical protein
MHPLGTVVVEGDHGLDGSAGRIRLSARDIASHRPDVLEHPGFVLLLFLDALVQRIAHVAEFVAAACRGGGHRRAEMPDDVIQVVQEGPVLLQLQARGGSWRARAARPPGHAGAALLLEDRDLKMMSRIVRAQMRRMESGDVVDVAAAAMAEERLAATA